MKVENNTFLITGGTGSFGSTMVRYLLKNNAQEIRILSRDEKKQDDLRKELNDDRVKFYIGDTKDYDSIANAVNGSDYVFQAAALKQVPSCEFFPIEAVKTNIIGTQNIIKASEDYGVKKVVVLSTDKAVYPINAMGMSKGLAEKVAISRHYSNANTQTVCNCTRYGNVMGSRGSVIPLFIKQILNEEPLTITDPNMTRFLMSLDDSVNLVMYAFENGQKGDLFVMKSPASTIEDLVDGIGLLFNKKPIKKIIGIRHGEKMHETLVSSEEMLRAEDRGDYFRLLPDDRDLNYEKYFTSGNDIDAGNLNVYDSSNTTLLSPEQVAARLSELNFVKKFL
ncbi:polysaccharide biosynthesis protein [Gammaproteobacteria bacterium]|nr:polysaccharide biosynthesis protein [Gammaproteobacteria bacterium]